MDSRLVALVAVPFAGFLGSVAGLTGELVVMDKLEAEDVDELLDCEVDSELEVVGLVI